MNYYERHLGDYAKDTAHLSMLEHGAYNLLLDRYYGTEAGIPTGDVYRVARAKSKPEKLAVDSVLKEFFTVVDGAWVKNRVEEEIQRYRDSIPAAEEKKLNDKERQRRARERRKALFNELRELGVVMPWDASTSELQTELSRVKLQERHGAVTHPVTRDNTASQSPVPSPQRDSRRGEAPSVPDPPDPRKAMFDLGVKLLGARHRGLIGKAVSQIGEKKVAEILGGMAVKPPVDPAAYFAKAIQPEERKVAI
jgi:uncharacterized protein YdaU (DUF1376 family)